jgi:hypothetical protein
LSSFYNILWQIIHAAIRKNEYQSQTKKMINGKFWSIPEGVPQSRVAFCPMFALLQR